MVRPDGAQDEVRQTKVLLVEDEMLIAMDLEDWLASLGFQVVGPFKRNRDAMAALEQGGIGFAVLDYLLADENTDELAECLTRRGVPYVFLTGSQELLVHGSAHGAPILEKPISRTELTKAFAMVTARPSSDAAGLGANASGVSQQRR